MHSNHDLQQEMRQNFIDYAMSVNTDRAIPYATSGLKPVARRVLWGALDSGFVSSKPHRKSARLVGDVMGKFHPHGDSSIYGALVRLAQPWIMRYPLIDFHGNKGNIGGDGAASMRYTEIRLNKLSEEGMLKGIKKGNVEFMPNYSEDDEEPVTLPAVFPNLLCNPNTGIGVAMACNWLPHNLTEVANAIFEYLEGKEPVLPGPDFPTGGLIINKNDIPNIMKTGHGSVKVRGQYKIEKQKIIFYEIPYGTKTEDLLTQIGKASDEKEVEGIKEIRNESDKKGIKLVIECEKTMSPETVVRKLFAKTDLQTSISYNQVALTKDLEPKEMNLKDAIEVYVEHNIECIVREAKFDLAKAEARLEIVNGLLKALEDIDNIIALIKKSENAATAKENLIKIYDFTENQAKAILDMKLAKLAKLEKIELEKEAEELKKSIDYYKSLITDRDEQKALLKINLTEIVRKFGDARRTELTQINLKPEEKEIETVTPEDCVVIISQTGDIKRVPSKSFKVQRKNGKGVKNEDDAILNTIATNTIDTLMAFTNKGKMYRVLVDNIPVGTNVSKGVRIGTLVKMEEDEKVIAITSLYRQTNAKYVVFFTKKGLIKKTSLEEFTKTKRTTGINAINIKEGDSIANVTFLNEEEVVLITKKGMSIHCPTKDITPIGRAAAGVKGIKLNEDDEVLIGLPIHKITDSVSVFTENGYGKKTKVSDFSIQARGGKGVYIYKPSNSTGELVGAAMVSDDDNLLLAGRPNSICISALDVPELSRVSLGNIMVKNSKIKSVVKL